MPEVLKRRHAIALGLKRYFTGKPCPKGHIAERYVGGVCVVCNKERELEPNVIKWREDYYARPEHKEKERLRMEARKLDPVHQEKERIRFSSEQRKAYRKAYRQSEEVKLREADRLQNDPQFKLKRALRRRQGMALKGKTSPAYTMEALGCSLAEAVSWLEAKFASEMTWQNHGSVWHIDHIKPLSSFDLTNRDQYLEACHYTNLQPLFVLDNLKKGAKTEWQPEQMAA